MGVFFAILSQALYGINNYIDKFFLEKYKITPPVISIYTGIFGLITGIIVLFLTGFYPTDFKSVLIILASGFLANLYVLPYFKALSTDETSRVIPLFQFIPVFVLILSFFVLGETLQIKQYIGAAIIILASFIISLKKFDKTIFKFRPAFWYMLLSSFLFSLSVILYKFGLDTIPFWNTLPYEGVGMALGALTIFLYKNNKSLFVKQTKGFSKKVFAVMTVNESFHIGSRYTAYFALSLISASLVNVLGGVGPFFVLMYGVILSLWFPNVLKEVITKEVVGAKLLSIVGMFIGLVLIFL